MKNLPKILSGFLIFAMFLCMVPGYMGPTFLPAYAEVFTGEFEGFTYYFDDETGTLVIDGEGPMPSFEGRMAPWSVYSDKVAHVLLNEGITSVSANAFTNFSAMEKITLPETIAAVDSAAFTGCAQIKSVEYTGEPAKLQEILAVSQAAEIAAVPVTAVSASDIAAKIGELVEKAAAAAAPETIRPMPVTYRADTDHGTSDDDSAPSVPNQGQPEMPQAKSGIFYSNNKNDGSILIEKYENGKLVASELFESGSIKSSTYKYDGDKLLSEFTIDKLNAATTKIYEYDGDRVVRIRTSRNSFTDNSIDERVTDIHYDGRNRIETEVFNKYKLVTYYQGDQVVLEENYTISSDTPFRRVATNVNGAVTTSVSEYFNDDGTLYQKTTKEKTIDENGRIIQETRTTESNGKTQNTVEKYTYQLDGNRVIAFEKRNETKGFVDKYSYTFDGDMVTGINYLHESSNNSSTSCSYELSYAEGMINNCIIRGKNDLAVYTYGRKNGTISSVNFQDETDGKLSRRQNIQFDNQRIVSAEESTYNTDGQKNSQILHNYKYNEDGSLAAQRIERQYGDEAVITHETTYVGDKETTYIRDEENGVLVNESESVTVNGVDVSYWDIRYGNKGKTILTHEYDEKGQYLGAKSETYNNDNVRTHSYVETYTYTDNGRRIVRNSVEYDETGKQKSAESNESFYTNEQQLSGKTTYYDANNTIQSSEIYEYEYHTQDTHQKSREKYTKYDSAGNILSLNVCMYAENGNIIEEHYINAENQQEKTETETFYDDNNTKTKSTYRRYNGNIMVYQEERLYSKEKLVSSTFADYDADGKLTQYTESTVSHDDLGNINSEIRDTYNSANQKVSSTETTYMSINGTSFVSTSTTYYSENGEWINKDHNEYDENGQIVSSSSYININGQEYANYISHSNGNQSTIVENQYDDQGNLTETKTTEETITTREDGTKTTVVATYQNGATEPSCIITYNHDAGGNMTSHEVKTFAEDRSYHVDTLNYNENREISSQSSTNYDSAGTITSTSSRTFNADRTSTEVKKTYDSAGTMTEKISMIIDANSINIEQVTETYNNGATEPSIVRKLICHADGTLSSTEEKIFNEDRSYSVTITNYGEDNQPTDASTKYYDSEGNEKTEPIEQPQPLTTNANSIKMLTAGIRPQMNLHPDLDSAQEQSDTSNMVTDGTGILNGAPSAGTVQLGSLPPAVAMPQADNIPAANTLQQPYNAPAANTFQQPYNAPAANTSQWPDNVPAAVVMPQLNYTPYDAPVTMKTTKGDVNVRKSPNTSSDLVGAKKTKDEIVKVVGVTADGWYVLENNGYVKAEFLKEVNITEYDTPVTLNVSADNVFIRKGPGQSFDSQDKVNTGTTVSVVSYSDDGWYKLSNGGYIFQDFVTDQPLSTGRSSGTRVAQDTETTSTAGSNNTDVVMFQIPVHLRVAADTADIHTGPASGYAVIRTLQKGEKLTAFGRLADWYLIDQTNYHFVNDKLVELDINSDAEENKNTGLADENKTKENENQEKDVNLNEHVTPKEDSKLNETVTPKEDNKPKENEVPLNHTATPSEAIPAA